MAGICEGRIVIVTGAGRGLGRAHALAFAAEGAKVVINDIGAELDGTGGSSGPAGEVVDTIRAMGGEAVANGDDISDEAGARHLFESTVDTFGDVHVIVNNAGILRDKMIFNMTVDEFDAVIRVHMRGSWLMSHLGATYWREKSKDGTPVDARIINTTSPAGLYGNVGQTNYGPAKAGLANMTVNLARELGRYGVTANAISPGARTRMTETIQRPGRNIEPQPGQFDSMAPDNVSPLVVWLGSPLSKHVTGRVFNVAGDRISVAEPWHVGPESRKGGARWEPSELSSVVDDLLGKALKIGPMGQVESAEPAAAS